MTQQISFLGLAEEDTRYEACRGVVVPVPYERTVSYGGGTARGPDAIIAASAYVELYDEILREEPYLKGGIHTADPVVAAEGEEPEPFLERLAEVARGLFADGKFPVFLGGEHTLTTGPVRAAREAYPDLSVLQLDAHADLRETYQDTPWSHACVMRRVFELGVPIVPVGIRALSVEEADFAHDNDVSVFWSHRITHGEGWMETAIAALTDDVYLTFDVDFFDPAIMPATGTPEPGGGFWHETLQFLGRVFRERNVVGMDVVELAPIAALHAPDFVAARLVHRCIGYRFHAWE
jgi:agmatinase